MSFKTGPFISVPIQIFAYFFSKNDKLWLKGRKYSDYKEYTIQIRIK